MNYEEAEAFKNSPELQNDPGTVNEQQLYSEQEIRDRLASTATRQSIHNFLDKERMTDKLEIGLLKSHIEELKTALSREVDRVIDRDLLIERLKVRLLKYE